MATGGHGFVRYSRKRQRARMQTPLKELGLTGLELTDGNGTVRLERAAPAQAERTVYAVPEAAPATGPAEKFRWDWTLLLVAVLITAADMLYFFALKQPDALLSVISVIRRGSVLVTFVCGAIVFKEGNLRAKGLNMLLMVAGIALLLIGS